MLPRIKLRVPFPAGIKFSSLIIFRIQQSPFALIHNYRFIGGLAINMILEYDPAHGPTGVFDLHVLTWMTC